ncbi:hypothetical protein [Paraburkholderia adhaesiva]|uniref:hypothetical protein n=1 Tax=Paraburkholderia adhaesiva TaxID=2883244 RepID=UPI001F45E5A9|nr:hypothetical protein [Paraburkholderia adhaesiva]
MENPKKSDAWYFRYPIGVAMVAGGIWLSNQPSTAAWVAFVLILMAAFVIYEALLLLVFALVSFFFLRWLAAIPVSLATLFFLWLVVKKDQ